MKIICAWCNREIGEMAPIEDPKITHGVCPECSKRVESEIEDLPHHQKGEER